MAAPHNILELADVQVRWPRPGGGWVDALARSSLAIHAGDFAVVRGPSGAGKTTLLLVAGGMLQPTSGSARCAGSVGFVFQTLELLPYLDIRDNVRLGLRRNGEARDVDRLLEELGIAERARHRPHQLSTGECQRVATARALASNPSLLLADEPTGNLDQEHAAVVLSALERHAQAGGAVILATHGDLGDIVATRQFSIESGILRERERAPT